MASLFSTYDTIWITSYFVNTHFAMRRKRRFSIPCVPAGCGQRGPFSHVREWPPLDPPREREGSPPQPPALAVSILKNCSACGIGYLPGDGSKRFDFFLSSLSLPDLNAVLVESPAVARFCQPCCPQNGIAALAALLSYRIFFTMAMWSYPRCAARAVRLAVTKLYTQRRQFDAEHQLDEPGEKQQH